MTFDIGYMQANPISWGPGEIDESEGEIGNQGKRRQDPKHIAPIFLRFADYGFAGVALIFHGSHQSKSSAAAVLLISYKLVAFCGESIQET